MGYSIGNIIRERRRLLKLHQPDLAELAGVSINTINKLEQDKANPTLNVLAKIAAVLGMELKLVVQTDRG